MTDRVHMLGDTLSIDLFYPRHDEVKAIEVGLCDVRAADSIRISYDFDRDGYRIEQASRFMWLPEEQQDRDWQEVAFIAAWARQETEQQTEERFMRQEAKVSRETLTSDQTRS